jgi:hypothetical protein
MASNEKQAESVGRNEGGRVKEVRVGNPIGKRDRPRRVE